MATASGFSVAQPRTENARSLTTRGKVCMWRCECGYQEFSRTKPPVCWCGRHLHPVDPFSDAAPGRAPTLADAPAELSNPLPTGITELDELLGGGFFIPGSVIIWGPPGSGKTTLAMHFARSSSRVLLVGLEMNAELYRYASRRAGLDARTVVLARGESAAEWIKEAHERHCSTMVVDSLGKVPNPLATMAALGASARAGSPRLVLAVAHNTRRDDARGGESLEHEPETLLFLGPGRITVRKHRIGPGGTAEIAWPP